MGCGLGGSCFGCGSIMLNVIFVSKDGRDMRREMVLNVVWDGVTGILCSLNRS